jgi:hypothetical protein
MSSAASKLSQVLGDETSQKLEWRGKVLSIQNHDNCPRCANA